MCLLGCTLAGLYIGSIARLDLAAVVCGGSCFSSAPRFGNNDPVGARGREQGRGAGAAALMLQQDPSDMYLGMLASRSVSDDVVDHLGLMAIYQAKTRVDARNA